jgi:hypothetical protein
MVRSSTFADHDEALVEHAIENVDETVGARRGY